MFSRDLLDVSCLWFTAYELRLLFGHCFPRIIATNAMYEHGRIGFLKTYNLIAYIVDRWPRRETPHGSENVATAVYTLVTNYNEIFPVYRPTSFSRRNVFRINVPSKYTSLPG